MHLAERGRTSLRDGGAYERPLSLSTMRARRPLWPKLLRASKAMPPVIGTVADDGDDPAVLHVA